MQNIIIISLIYRLIFCEISQRLHQILENENINLCYLEQKGFISKRAESQDLIAIANALVHEVLQNGEND